MHQISLCRLPVENIFTLSFMKGLRFDLKDLGFEEKWGFEIWLTDLNTFLERFEI